MLSASHTAISKNGEHCNSPHAGHFGYTVKTCILRCSVWLCHCFIDNNAHSFWKAGKWDRQTYEAFIEIKIMSHCVHFAPHINGILLWNCLISVWVETTSIRKRLFSDSKWRVFCGIKISSFLLQYQGNEAHHLPRIATWSRVGICIVQSMCWLSINKSDMAHNERKHLKTKIS